jgi:hypothetical protein
MKKWLYVIAPGIMLAVFLFFYMSSRTETLARDAQHRQDVAREKAEADQKKAAAEANARADADKRAAQRAADEAKTAQDKLDKYNADMKRIQEDTDKSNALGESYAKQVSELTIELDTLHKQKDALSREGFDLLKKIELAEVARRNAELEDQRMVDRIANRADESQMVKLPPPPPKES